MNMSRTEDEIEVGTLPAVGSITLGGVAYPALEPTNMRARAIRSALAAYERAATVAGGDGGAQVDLLETTMDTCLRNFSDEIEADWERIARTATDRERLAAMVAVRDSVMVAFLTLAAAATPAPNRTARRAKR
jgi:hypothetical protein